MRMEAKEKFSWREWCTEYINCTIELTAPYCKLKGEWRKKNCFIVYSGVGRWAALQLFRVGSLTTGGDFPKSVPNHAVNAECHLYGGQSFGSALCAWLWNSLVVSWYLKEGSEYDHFFQCGANTILYLFHMPRQVLLKELFVCSIVILELFAQDSYGVPLL